jgi:hypothetical protein
MYSKFGSMNQEEPEIVDSQNPQPFSKRESNTSVIENKVLSQMCDNIHQNQALLNRHIRRMFSLNSVLM